jgi:hypothetical protein
VNLGHASCDFGAELSTAQMNVKQGCLDTAMPREPSDLMDVPVVAGQIRQTKVPGSVGSELQDAALRRQLMHHFGPGPDGDRLAGIAP